MTIVLNGQPHEVPEGTTLEDLVLSLGLDPRGFAAAVDGKVVPRARHAAVVLARGAHVEIIRAVGGG